MVKDQLCAVDIYGRKLCEIANIAPSRLGGSTMVHILTKAQVASKDAQALSQRAIQTIGAVPPESKAEAKQP